MQAVDPVTLTAQHVHVVLEGLPLVQHLQVALVAQLFFCHHLASALGLLDVVHFHQDRVHFLAKTDNLPEWVARALILLVFLAVEEVLWRVVAGVIETMVHLHVSVHMFRPDLKEQAVFVRVQQLAILHLKVIVVEVVHGRLAEVQDAHAHVHLLH